MVIFKEIINKFDKRKIILGNVYLETIKIELYIDVEKIHI